MWACSSVGRARAWHVRGRRFDPCQVHQNKSLTLVVSTPHNLFYYCVVRCREHLVDLTGIEESERTLDASEQREDVARGGSAGRADELAAPALGEFAWMANSGKTHPCPPFETISIRIAAGKSLHYAYDYMKFIFAFLFISQIGWAAAPTRIPISLTLSGGVSLAAYETGFLYYLGQQLNDGKVSDLRIVTGASAGSINGVVAIINACSPKTTSPHDSINWRAWMPLGIREIAKREKITSLSIFSREGLEKYTGMLKQEFLAGLREDCDVVLGMAVARKTPLKVEVRPGLTYDRHAEFILLRIRGRGVGRPPQIENYPLNEPGQRQLFLPLNGDAANDYARMEDVFTASAQFPLAFPPFPLKHCDFDSTAKKDSCKPDKAITTHFIDGGLFDNTPLTLNTVIADKLFSKTEKEKLVYSVITLDGKTHPVPSTAEDEKPSVIRYMAELLGQFTETARNRSVSDNYVNRNGIYRQTFSNDKFLPRSSQYYVAFTGFLDRGFREYDFYLGMFEARHYFEQFISKSPDPQVKKMLTAKLDAEYAKTSDPEWQPMFCLMETYSSDKRAQGSCAKLQNQKTFPLLLKVNSELVKNRCDSAPEEAKQFPACRMAKNIQSESKFEERESDPNFFFRRLEELEYPYETGGKHSHSGKALLRAELEPLFKVLVKKQPKEQRIFLGEATRTLLDSLSYKPPNKFTRVGVGGHVQVTRGHLLFDSPRLPWWIVDYGFMARGLDTYLNTNPNAFALAPFAGLAANLTFGDAFWLNYELGARLGYNHAFESHAEICDRQETYQSSLYCRSGFFQPHASVGLLGRVRIEVGSVIYFSKTYKSDLSLIAEVQF